MRSLLLAVTLSLLSATAGFTADLTWTGGNGLGSNDISLSGNWGGPTPAANDTMTFPNVANKSVANGVFAQYMAFGPLTIDASGYVISGPNAITLKGGLFLNGANTATLQLPMRLQVPVAFTVSNASGRLTVSQSIDGAGGIIKSGPGVMTLNGSQAYTGPTTVLAGTLEVGNTLPGQVRLSGGTLAGTGIVDGIVSLGQGISAIDPGAYNSSTPGKLRSTDDVTLTANDEVRFTITGTGIGADQLEVDGEVDLRVGTDGILLRLQNGFVPAANTSFTLIDNDGNDPLVFDAVNPSNYLYAITLNSQLFYLFMVGGDGNDMVLKKASPSSTTLNLITPATSVSAYGNTATFTVSAIGPADGQVVSFWDGSRFLASVTIGTPATTQARLQTAALLPGEHKITALFAGNGTHSPARSAVITHTVTGFGTATGLNVTPGSPQVGGTSLTLTATITETPSRGTDPTGEVIFFDNGTELARQPVSANQAVHTTSTLIAGNHSFTAVYVSDGEFDSSASGAFPFVLTGATTSTTLSSSLNPAVAGQDVEFVATVATANAGSVEFRDGSTTIATVAVDGAGVARFTTSGLAAGNHVMTAVYTGTPQFQADTSNSVNQTISAHPDGSGGGSGGGVELEESGGCGMGGGVATLALALLMLVGLRLRRD